MPILETPSDVPSLDIDMVREQFEAIWQKNTVQVDIIRDTNAQGGDYFHDDESNVPVTRQIYLNVQGTHSDWYKREKYGITTTDSEYHAYARWYEDIQNNDRIVWAGKRFVVANLNKSLYGGLFAFQEFDLRKIDKV